MCCARSTWQVRLHESALISGRHDKCWMLAAQQGGALQAACTWPLLVGQVCVAQLAAASHGCPTSLFLCVRAAPCPASHAGVKQLSEKKRELQAVLSGLEQACVLATPFTTDGEGAGLARQQQPI